MKNKGKRFKRAVDSLNKLHLDYIHTKGYVVETSKKHPNYFTAVLWDSCENEWITYKCAYISTYSDKNGNWIKLR